MFEEYGMEIYGFFNKMLKTLAYCTNNFEQFEIKVVPNDTLHLLPLRKWII